MTQAPRGEVSRFLTQALVMICVSGFLGACGGPDPCPPAPTSAPQPPPTAPTAPVSVTAVSQKDLGRICRATIGSLMGRDPAIIEVTRFEGEMAYVAYARPDDGKIWKDRCRLEGGKVIWSTVDVDEPGSGPGRWRMAADDEVITWRLDGDKVSIETRYTDGSGDTKTYTVR